VQPLKVILHHDLAADNAVGHCRKSLLPVPDPDAEGKPLRPCLRAQSISRSTSRSVR
jgi:hypothetical protein